tara:strand:- start:781 stop:1365 length:585 start_codon:yes stop_codon:yes gene_type:complete
MPIDRENKVVFIHIPRCAGTTILKTVSEEHGRMEHIGHHFWEDYKSYLSEWDWNDYRKFCIFRDPLERFLSAYRYAQLEKSVWHDRDTQKHHDYDICKSVDINVLARLLEKGTTLWHESWTTQSSWINGLRDKTILKFENIVHEIKKIYPNLKLSKTLNSSKKYAITIPPNDYTKNFLREYYQKDYKIWENLKK